MCRLYTGNGKKKHEFMHILAGFYFKREDVEILEREVRAQRAWERENGHDKIGGECTEKDVIRYAVSKYINELREEQQKQQSDRILWEFDQVQVEDAYRKAGWREDGTMDAITRRLQRAEELQ